LGEELRKQRLGKTYRTYAKNPGSWQYFGTVTYDSDEEAGVLRA
jgi:hypothetical protein